MSRGTPRRRDAQQHFGHAPAIERRGVDEVHPQIQRHPHRAQRLVQIDLPEFLAPSDEAPKLRTGSLRPVLPSWRCSMDWSLKRESVRGREEVLPQMTQMTQMQEHRKDVSPMTVVILERSEGTDSGERFAHQILRFAPG